MKENRIVIRKVAPEHISDIVKISSEVFEYHNQLLPRFFAERNENADTQRYCGLTENENAIFLVALAGSSVAGYLLAMISDKPWQNITPVCSLDEFGVSASCRRHGIGTALFNALKEECGKRKIRGITLNVYANNENAVNFYKKAGCRIRSLRMDISL